ncbi:MAG TPA: 16S rRNA (guanine(527)-N(7))-methyltransferase RsmG [Caulobacteraceae bacterium]|nr:16S rRNA (guanine(527)-N(7))-methyltransferase RsmG [Caulobacteraceae bacterium]
MSDASTAPHEGLGREALSRALEAARPELDRYRGLLARGNAFFNLAGASAMDNFWSRHVLDCAQLTLLAPAARTWADVGAGNGLPGIVLAILLKDAPGARIHLIESVEKKCAFLRSVVCELHLPALVEHARAETLDLSVEVVTARACAPLSRLLPIVRPYLARGARGLFLKGARAHEELREAGRRWRFRSRAHQSLSDSRGVIIEIEGAPDAL